MKKLTSLLVTCLFAGAAIAQPSGDQPDSKRKKGKGKESEETAVPVASPTAAPKKAQVKKAPSAPKKAPAAPKEENREARKNSEAPASPVVEKKKERKESKPPAAEKPDAETVAKKRPPAKVEAEAAAPTTVDKPTAKVAQEKRGEANPDMTSDNAKKRRKNGSADSKRDSRESADASNRDDKKRDSAKSSADASQRDDSNRDSSDRSNKSADRQANSQTVAEVTGERRPRTRTANARKPAPEKVKEIRAKHVNFRAEARPERVPTVTFTENRRIENSDRWEGAQYEVFRTYRPERHDESWYRSRYTRIELISGGYYYQRDNYWYPAWGYRPTAEYYAYDGPIYVGQRSDPPDRIIADVQAALLEMDYYKGEVDGLLGPLTRAALTGYQTDQGLEITAAIDEPTLYELGLQ